MVALVTAPSLVPLGPTSCRAAAPSSSCPIAPASPPRCSATACCRNSRSSSSSAITMPFVDSPDKVDEAIRLVNETGASARSSGRSCSARSSTRTRARRSGAHARRSRSTSSRSSSRRSRPSSAAEELARRGTLARHREQPRVFRAHGGDQLHADARRRRDDAGPREGAGDPGRRLALRQDADLALPRAAVRRARRELSAHAGRLRRPPAARLDRRRIARGCSGSRSSPSACARSARSAGRAAATPRSTTAATRCARRRR